MYRVTLILPGTKEGMKNLEEKYAEILAKITVDMLNKEELKVLIERLEEELNMKKDWKEKIEGVRSLVEI